MDIISVPGRLVRDPVTRRVVDQTPIAIDPTDPTWSRLLKDGDVIEAPEGHVAPVVAPTPAPEAAAEPQEHTA